MTARSAAPRRKKPERRPVCFIVGAGPGIGAALAEAFAGEGYDIALLARGTAKLRELCADLSRKTGRKVCAYEIGRASGRERVCQYGWISVGAGSLTKKKKYRYVTTAHITCDKT